MKIFIFLFCSYGLIAQSGSSIYVNALNNNSTIKNGQNWETAFIDLQNALNITENGDTIWIAKGIYYPSKNLNRDASFIIPNGVKIYGGFLGVENTLMEQNILLNQVILSGDIGIKGDSSDNIRHVVTLTNVDSSTIINGITIEGGNAGIETSSSFDKNPNGGGIYIQSTSGSLHVAPWIVNCVFKNNLAKAGGAIYCKEENGKNISLNIKNCTFLNNKAFMSGGGIYKKGTKSNNSGIIIDNCNFNGNQSIRFFGGAISLLETSNNYISNSKFLNNQAWQEGGGIYFSPLIESGNIQIDNCSFENNISISGGGGFSFYSQPSSFQSTNQITINNSEFIGNTTYNNGGGLSFSNFSKTCLIQINNTEFKRNFGTSGGGGIYFIGTDNTESSINLDACIFRENFGEVPGGGGILYRGFGMDPANNHNNITNTIFDSNEGAFAILSGNPGVSRTNFTNCVFYENGDYPMLKNWDINFYESTFYNEIFISNSIVWETQKIAERLFYNNNLDDLNVNNYYLNNCLVNISSCEFNNFNPCQEGILYLEDPLFVNPDFGDFSLEPCSPAINRGENTYLTGLDTDIIGNPRIQDNMVDLGAYENKRFQIDSIITQYSQCLKENNGFVKAITNGCNDLSYFWERNGENGVGNTNLSPGTYQFTITDGLQRSLNIQNLVIRKPSEISISVSIRRATSPESLNGQIEIIEITGGRPPYQISWSNNDTSLLVKDLAVGDYHLKITDKNGCSKEFIFEIDFTSSTHFHESSFSYRIYPNPVFNHFTNIQTNSQEKENLSIQIYDATGRLLKNKKLIVDIGKNSYPIEIPKTKGFYLLIIRNSTNNLLGYHKIQVL